MLCTVYVKYNGKFLLPLKVGTVFTYLNIIPFFTSVSLSVVSWCESDEFSMIQVCSVIRVCLIIAEEIQTKLTKNSTALRNSWSHRSAGDSPRDDVDDILACLIRFFPFLSSFLSLSLYIFPSCVNRSFSFSMGKYPVDHFFSYSWNLYIYFNYTFIFLT